MHQFKEKNFVPRVTVLYHGGEPLLNKSLPEMIAILKALGVKKTVITTNTSLLTADMARKLTEAGLDEMKASFDGRSPEESNRIRKNGNFDRDSENLLYYLKINQKTHVKIANVQICTEEKIHRYLDGENLDAPEYLRKKFSKFENVSFVTVPARIWPSPEKYGVPYKTINIPVKKPVRCPRLEETMTVLANGNVVPCCDDITGCAVLGNIMKEDIFSIRENANTRRFFQAFKSQSDFPKICQNCVILSQTFLVKE